MAKAEFLVTEKILVKARQLDVFAFHADVNNISKVVPPLMKVTVSQLTWPVQQNSEVTLQFSFLGSFISFAWKLKFIAFNSPESFVDCENDGLFKKFEHTHQFIKDNDEQTTIQDTINYSLGEGFMANLLGVTVVKLALKIFLISKLGATKDFLERE